MSNNINSFEELKPGLLFAGAGRHLNVLSTTGWKVVQDATALPSTLFLAIWNFSNSWFLIEKLDLPCPSFTELIYNNLNYWDKENYQCWKVLCGEEFFILFIHKEDLPFMYLLNEYNIPIVTTFR